MREEQATSWLARSRPLYVELVHQSAQPRRGAWSALVILSALYGLVEPDAEIPPYDYTLNKLGLSERKAWAAKVLDQLLLNLSTKSAS